MCSVFPKDPYIEVGTDIEVVCHSSCIHGDVFWTVGNTSVDRRLSDPVSSSHTILTLRNFTQQNATVLCRSVQTLQILGGTTIRTYCTLFCVCVRACGCLYLYFKKRKSDGHSALGLNLELIWFKQPDPEPCHVSGIMKIRPSVGNHSCSRAVGRIRWIIRWKYTTRCWGGLQTSLHLWKYHGLHVCRHISKTCVSFRASLQRPSQTEICSSRATTCTSKPTLTSGKRSLEGNVTVVVRARTPVWEAYSDPHEFDSLHICKSREFNSTHIISDS